MDKRKNSEVASLANELTKRFTFPRRKTKIPIVVAMIGLIGSGKSSVAREIAKHSGAIVIEGDYIRVALRKRGQSYESAREIAEHIAYDAVRRGSNVVLDSDFVDPKKRASLEKKAGQMEARVHYVRTHCDFDIATGRIVSANYKNSPEDFFGGAGTSFKGSAQNRGAVVKMRELLRRVPHHYQWEHKDGGRWLLKKPPCKLLADIDTTHPLAWKKEVEKSFKKLLSR